MTVLLTYSVITIALMLTDDDVMKNPTAFESDSETPRAHVQCHDVWVLS